MFFAQVLIKLEQMHDIMQKEEGVKGKDFKLEQNIKKNEKFGKFQWNSQGEEIGVWPLSLTLKISGCQFCILTQINQTITSYEAEPVCG